MGFLEEDLGSIASMNNQLHALNYSNRIPTLYGKKLGMLTNQENTPIQEISSLISIDLQLDDTSDYKAHLSDNSFIAGATSGNSQLQYLANTLIA